MAESGNDTGLITKTVEKLEKRDAPPVQPQAPPEPESNLKKPRKKTLVMGGLLLGVAAQRPGGAARE